jgi:hypothetical protein
LEANGNFVSSDAPLMERVTRRKLLASGAVVAGGLAAGRAGGALDVFGGTDGEAPLVATLRQVSRPNALTASVADAEVKIRLAPGAHVFKDKPADLSAFVPDERIVLEGRQEKDVFVASTLVPLYDVIDTQAVSVSRSAIETRAGRVRVSSHALYFFDGAWNKAPVKPIEPGDQLQVVAREDPRTGELVGVRFIPESTHED